MTNCDVRRVCLLGCYAPRQQDVLQRTGKIVRQREAQLEATSRQVLSLQTEMQELRIALAKAVAEATGTAVTLPALPPPPQASAVTPLSPELPTGPGDDQVGASDALTEPPTGLLPRVRGSKRRGRTSSGASDGSCSEEPHGATDGFGSAIKEQMEKMIMSLQEEQVKLRERAEVSEAALSAEQTACEEAEAAREEVAASLAQTTLERDGLLERLGSASDQLHAMPAELESARAAM